jgi:nicotinamidase-related amidase
MPLESLVAAAGGPEHVGIFCVDVINGFCHEGPLHSARVRAIIDPIVELFTTADAAGVTHFVLPHDAHDPAAAEFADFPPHCIRGTTESHIVPELMALPFASSFILAPKNCIHSGVGTKLNAWLDQHSEVTHRIVVGDCTDLCAYQLAMHLKVRANAANRTDPVILPANCVDTYDIPVDSARAEQIPAHPADLFHAVFLYNMAMNGIRVVSSID